MKTLTRVPKLRIWTSKIMPDLWLLALFCPIKKKFHTPPYCLVTLPSTSLYLTVNCLGISMGWCGVLWLYCLGTLPSTVQVHLWAGVLWLYCLGTLPSTVQVPLWAGVLWLYSLRKWQACSLHQVITFVVYCTQHNIILANIVYFIICFFFAGLNPSFLGSERLSANVDRIATTKQWCTQLETLGNYCNPLITEQICNGTRAGARDRYGKIQLHNTEK